ncbi:MAG: YchJ family metal-binding protein [Nitrosomonas sp.]|nr:YchJ family metal-binding protein [Nitrosomonas sp.]
MKSNNKSCPCCSGKNYIQCCARYIDGGELPETSEQLMRSRYSAYVGRNKPYLLQTWHTETRPKELDLEIDIRWLALEIIECQGGKLHDDEGIVEFAAQFCGTGKLATLYERSHFKRENDRWAYFDGEISQKTAPEKIGRNSPCPCGSGKKFKYCCG